MSGKVEVYGLVSNKDFLFEVARGSIPGYSSTIVRGHIPTFTAGAGFVDVAEQGDLSYLVSAEPMNIRSSATADVSGGTGLWNLVVNGVNQAGSAVSEIVSMNGLTNAQTSNEFLRVNNMVGLKVGSTGWNEGTVVAVAASASTIQSQMDATESLSQGSHYTVPVNHKGYLLKVELNTAQIAAGQTPTVEWKGYARVGGAGNAWIQLFDKKMDTGVTDELEINVPIFTQMAGRTDIRMRADTDIDATEVRSRMYLLLVQDDA
jgi:hypothetical protein